MTIDVDDVQSLVFSGHSRLPASLVMGFTVRDAARARRDLAVLATNRLSTGFGGKSRTNSVQVLLTAAGIQALGGTASDLAGFSRQFQQGIVGQQRSRALGDANRNAPAGWGWSDAEAHVVALVYAADEAAVAAVAEAVIAELAPGLPVMLKFPVRLPMDGREPFGFADGLTVNRADVGDGRVPEPGVTLLPAGEVVLGYENAAGVAPAAPPLGENGSLVVFRQLEQDVQAFWNFWRSAAKDEEEAVWLASKALGRWPNGMPVSGTLPTAEPEFDATVALASFRFRDDSRGRGCPFGAHVRRANPRDGLGDDPEASLAAVAQHRMVRRGRVYGPPVPRDWYPEAIRRAGKGSPDAPPAGARGLLFICLCADIARQFEFVQQTWLNNPKFLDLYDEVDPIAAGHGIPSDSHRFSIPRPPLRRRLNDVTRWVRVRGGGYFLLPGRRALMRFLAEA